MEVILVLAMGAIGGVVAIRWLLAERARSEKIKSTLQQIRFLKKLIGLSQRHRGLSATYLQGQHEVKRDISALRETISQCKSQLVTHTSLLLQPRWQAYMDHWPRLESNAMTLSVKASFEQHTQLIENLLYLLEDVAEEYQFTVNDADHHRLHFLWRDFPMAIEFMGQARAVGASVATKGVSTQIDKVKLGYLHDKILQLTEVVLSALSERYSHSSKQQIDDARQRCTALTSMMKSQLIDTNTVNVDSKRYFDLASSTMDSFNRLLDNELNAL